ncbi:hypothetical protein SARC_01350 [Sphaeroforma arctica JP610]|uniref:Uncharacterized protein n=1 Tax=Sphaeroforma arctica JP610 TaxID=667725 RepID=A0A0L0GBY2_9EUKA|nr:hypothetical protein SARC_01350 [Sphaeroforma arctica JP610]KNC86522.1 hypothetical protein SARC_01350 [Sphaeroforma arctica JP610]|eukprot:XP_014160424.1 hypothetical protein SARC_01350 [Sphaeroforma arctica JP610]
MSGRYAGSRRLLRFNCADTRHWPARTACGSPAKPILQNLSDSIVYTRVARCEQKFDELIITLDFPIDVVKPLDDLSESYRNFIIEALGLRDWQVANNKSPVIRVADSGKQIAEIRSEAFSSIEPQYAHFTSRGFAPNRGVPEDPVTGSAHCALASFWREYLQWKTTPTTKTGASSDMIEMIAYQSSKRGGDLTLHVSPDKHDDERIYLSGVALSQLQGSIL